MPAEGTPLSQNWDSKLHRVAFRKFSMEGLTGIPRVANRFLNTIPTNNLVEQDILHSGLPAVPHVASDLLKSPLSSFKIAPPVGYRQKNYRMIYKYTRKAAKYDNAGKITGVVRTMGESMAYTVENVGHQILNRAANAAFPVGWDKLSLANAAHKLVGTSQTYSNVGTAGSYPSPAMLQEIYTYFKRVPNDQGWAIPVGISMVITAPELGPAWRQLVSAPGQVGTGTGANVGGAGVLGSTDAGADAPNAFSMITSDMIVESPYLADTGMSVIIGEGHQMNMFVGEAPRTRTWNEENPEAILHEITSDFVVGATDARRIYVFPGA